MKKILTIVALCVGTLTMAQPPKFQEVVEVKDATASQLYSRAKEWFADSFKSAKDVIQLEDVANFKVIGKGNTGEYYSYKSVVVAYALANFTVKIECKKGRYRYTVYDITEKSKIGGEWLPAVSLDNIYSISTPEKFNAMRVKKGMKPLSGKKLERKSKPWTDRYNNLVAEIAKIRESLKIYMGKINSKDNDW